MLNSARKSITFAAALVSLAALTGTASAQTTWQKDHPRRTEVNGRLANQNRRIHNDVKDGTLSKGQAAQLHHEDHQVRNEERDDGEPERRPCHQDRAAGVESARERHQQSDPAEVTAAQKRSDKQLNPPSILRNSTHVQGDGGEACIGEGRARRADSLGPAARYRSRARSSRHRPPRGHRDRRAHVEPPPGSRDLHDLLIDQPDSLAQIGDARF